MNKVAVIIPVLNEAGSIRSLVSELRAVSEVEVIIVDNGSTDTTAAEAQSAGARVVPEPRLGYGYACAAGVAAAADADIVAFTDGDYSYLPSELPVLLAPILAGQADLVLGSRPLGQISKGALPAHQRIGNWLASRLMNVLYGLHLTDLGPYRAIRRPPRGAPGGSAGDLTPAPLRALEGERHAARFAAGDVVYIGGNHPL